LRLHLEQERLLEPCADGDREESDEWLHFAQLNPPPREAENEDRGR
jgi:hypothetical protein